MKNPEITIQYIYHSGFVVETPKSVLVFDYYQGTVNHKDDQVKPTFVFSSHIHPDHFNPQIFEWGNEDSNIKYILSSDIKGSNTIPQKDDNIIFISPYEEIKIKDLTIKAYGSTDEGVSFLVQCDDISIFHAGDLNWWYWWGDSEDEIVKAERMFKEEVAKIKGVDIDIAFFPVDPRLEMHFSDGAEYFIAQVKPHILIPMHFGDNYNASKMLADKIEVESCRIIQFTHRGQVIPLAKAL
jgi:L-ascorbate metabolism protein UlaG (beta-lactamase superfamily)